MLLSELRSRYKAGENITELLKASDGTNSTKTIEIAYDLQAGSYVRDVFNNLDDWKRYSSEISDIVKRFIFTSDSVLDCGTGEMTSLSGVVKNFPPNIELLAFDISLSRIKVGNAFVRRMMRSDLADKIRSFCATMEHIPLSTKSIDVVMTRYALEPNRGREKLLLRELFRVSRRHVILIEPYYEGASQKGKERMDNLGYIRGLDEHILKCGGAVTEKIKIINIANPLNPAYCWIIKVNNVEISRNESYYCCPISGTQLFKKDGYYWSNKGLYAYPIIQGIPILKPEYGIVLTQS